MNNFQALFVLVNLLEVIVCRPCDTFCNWHYTNYEEHLDISSNPCDDFYQYACGNWRLPYVLRSLNATDTVTAIQADNKKTLQHYFERQNAGEGDENVLEEREEKKPKSIPVYRQMISNVTRFYGSCMKNRFGTNLQERIKIYTTLLEINQTEVNRNQSFKWEAISGKLRGYGVQSLWEIFVKPNWQAADQSIFYLTPLRNEFMTKTHNNNSDEFLLLSYERYIRYILFGLGLESQEAKQKALEIIEFEKLLMKLQLKAGQSVVLKEPQSIANLQHQLPSINFRLYFENVFRDLSWHESLADQLLVVVDVDFLQELGSIVNKQSSMLMENYFLVKLLMHFDVHIHETDTLFDQTYYCLDKAHQMMPLHLSALFLYLQQTNPSDFLRLSQFHISQVFQQLKQQLLKRLNATNPTSNLSKLHDMRIHLLNYEQLITSGDNNADGNDDEDAVEIDSNYDRNLLALARHRNLKDLLHLFQHMGIQGDHHYNSSQICGPMDVQPYYNVKRNCIEIPLGLLRLPFYNQNSLKPQLFGSFVAMIARVLLNAFDFEFDFEVLNLDNIINSTINWNSKAVINDEPGHTEKCQLLLHYKNDFSSLNENIADIEGLQLALKTLNSSTNSDFNSTTNSNSNRKITDDDLRLFFISFAQTWCSDILYSHLHATNRDRVNNVVQNFNEFSTLFKCNENELDLGVTDKCNF